MTSLVLEKLLWVKVVQPVHGSRRTQAAPCGQSEAYFEHSLLVLYLLQLSSCSAKGGGLSVTLMPTNSSKHLLGT